MNDEKAIEQLEEFLVIDDWSAVYMPYLQDAIEYVINRIEADRWISVSERLPEEYGNYLVFTSDNDIDVGTFNQFKNSWSMCDADGFYWAREKGIEITHWRPLPKPYESEDK